MIFKWESDEEKLQKYMKIPPKKRLEWLRKINEFTAKFSSKKIKAVQRKLRE